MQPEVPFVRCDQQYGNRDGLRKGGRNSFINVPLPLFLPFPLRIPERGTAFVRSKALFTVGLFLHVFSRVNNPGYLHHVLDMYE